MSCPALQDFTLVDGVHTFECRAVNGAGLQQPPPYPITTTVVDTTPPVLVITSGPSSVFTSNTTTIVCVAKRDANGVTMAVALDDATSITVHDVGCVTFTAVADGNHSVVVTGTDDAGNVGAPVAVWFVVDTSAPDTTAVGFGGSSYGCFTGSVDGRARVVL